MLMTPVIGNMACFLATYILLSLGYPAELDYIATMKLTTL